MSFSPSSRIMKLSGLTALALFVAMAGWGQGSSPSSGGMAPQPSTPPIQNPPSGQLPGAGPSGQLPGAAPVANPVEDKDYKALYDARTGDPQKHLQMGEDFVKKYPTSKYTGDVYASMAGDCLALGEEDKLFADAQKAIDFDPDNVSALSLMAWAGARRIDPRAPDAADRYAKLENYAHHAITLLASMQKPAGIDDATFNAARNDQLSLCHSGLGFMDFLRQRYADTITELTLAVQLANSPDQVDYFILGAANERANHFDEAIAAFGKCAEQAGGVQDRCKTGIDETKKRALEQPAPSH